MIKLNDNMVLNNNDIKFLISEIFYDIENNYFDKNNYINYIKDRAILSTKNEDVDEINYQIINIFPGNAQEYLFISRFS
jgi:hypothetical protein